MALDEAQKAVDDLKTPAGRSAAIEREMANARRELRQDLAAAVSVLLRAARFLPLLVAYYEWSKGSYIVASVLLLAFAAVDHEERHKVLIEAEHAASAQVGQLDKWTARRVAPLEDRVDDLTVLLVALENANEARLAKLEQG